ncbi:MAG: efflux RND transporter periplasmic adaptor subunit [Burkholderiaceae bacterium]|jgi:multidrug efflux system membrane fusion protein|nr:efflux RND transporter periplasmic adaptor subunit [Burkholderiaceae bacterium]
MAESELQNTGFPTRYQGRPRRRWLSVLLALLFIAVLAGGAVYLVHRAGKPSAAGAAGGGPGFLFGRGGSAGPSVTVGEATAQAGDLPILIDALGTITPPKTATLVPQISGTLIDVAFTEGQMVKQGQVLARIDPRPYQAALTQAQGTLAKDQAQLAAAQVTLERYRKLLAQDSIARQDFDTQNATVKQLQGTVETDQAAVQTAQINLGYTTITAPFGGLIGLRTVDPGNYVSTGTTGGIATLTQVQPIDVVFAVPQDRIPDIQAAARTGHLPVTALDRARAQQLATGRFLTLDNQVNISTGTVRAKARFDNAEGKLFPNQFVNVRLQLGTVQGVLVPVTAVRTGPNGDYVYVIDQDSVAHMRPVKRGLATDAQIQIVQGLQAGEQIVSEGGDRVKDGAPVRRADAAGPGGAGTPSAGASGARRAASGSAAGASAAGHPGWVSLPPQVRAKLQGMTPEQRHAYFQQLRQQQAASGAQPAASGAASSQP